MDPHRQQGFSIIELMVAMTLSLILMAGVLSIFYSSKVTYFANEKVARLQENGRIALDLMVHDVRSAGFPGCAKGTLSSTLNTPTSLLWNYAQPVQGFEANGSGSYSPAIGMTLTPTPANDSDVLVVRMLLRDGRAVLTTADMAATNSDVQIPGATVSISKGQMVMIGDCNASSIFQVTNIPAGTIEHKTGVAGISPGNSTANLGYMYLTGARIIPVQTVIYWVGDDGINGPALWRQMGSSNPEMLVEGIQAMQVAYGEDTDGDRVANNYFAANNVTNWDNIISVSLALLARSDATGSDIDSGTYSLLATGFGGKLLGPYNDRRQRMLFSTTIAVRNRAL